MEQNRNMEQGGTAAAVPAEKKNENRKREVSGKDAQIIRAFLESVGIYEADALRVSIAIADGKVSADNISADDRLALNRYLNSSTDNDRLTADNAQGHRLNRAFGLLERVAEFCDKQQLVTVNRALLFHRCKCGGHQPCRIKPCQTSGIRLTVPKEKLAQTE